jgi:ribonuclease HI
VRHAPVIVYTDGACSGNPGPGGWAWAVAPDGIPRASGGEGGNGGDRRRLREGGERPADYGAAEGRIE